MEFDLWQAGLLVAVGIAAGFLNVMAGGGSLLTVPVMVFMGLPGPVANGTNRIAILAQNICPPRFWRFPTQSDPRGMCPAGRCSRRITWHTAGGRLVQSRTRTDYGGRYAGDVLRQTRSRTA